MKARAQTKPRKLGSQRRSRITVDALLGATARILVSRGYDQASTNKIARTAGVSIGSLYQYFPGKEALVAELIRRHKQEMMQLLSSALVQVSMRPVGEAARELVKVMIDAHRVNPRLHRVLVEEVPRLGQMDEMQSIDRETYALIRTYLEAHQDEIDVADVNLAAFICFVSVEALTHEAVVHRPEVLDGQKTDTFVDEVTGLVLRYLRIREGGRPGSRVSCTS